MPDQLTTGDVADTNALLQGTVRIAHTLDNDDENVLTKPALFTKATAAITGSIMVVLWGEDVSAKALMDVEIAHERNVLVKKIYLTGTTIGQNDFTLLR